MIKTPLGEIKAYVDGACQDYEACIHHYSRPPIDGRPLGPLAECYRIHVFVEELHSIRCAVELKDTAIPNTGASGEKYVDAEFVSSTTFLTIGIEDENSAFDSMRTAHGMEYIIKQSIEEVVFGIAWATDYQGVADVRTWFTAALTLDVEREKQ